ncbi:hypothetical protein MBLNU230_g2407t1 [Neophaeotheca triangularis]
MIRPIILLIACVVALGGFNYGLDSGIVATTFGHDSFRVYMYGPSREDVQLSGAIVSVYNAGQAVGGLTVGYLADKFSRRWTMELSLFLNIVAGILQCAAVNPGMLIVGRLVGGISSGQLLSLVPMYLAEVAPPSTRGFLVGMQGMMIAIGFGVANWIGYAGSFASGDVQWRVPLGMQIPIPVLMAGLLFFVPFSPRWLVQQDRHEEAKNTLIKLHGNGSDGLADQELLQIQQQIRFEQSLNLSWIQSVRSMFSKRYIKRTALAAFIVTMGQLSGSSVIQNFQNIFYDAVGFTGQTALLISGVYGMMGILGQIFYLVVVADRWPRKITLWSGSIALSVMLAICMALSAEFGSNPDGTASSNQAGARASIAFIFLYSFCYAVFFNAMIWVVPSELLPTALRAKGLAFAVFTKAVVAIALSQVTPLAIRDVSWRYYSLFIATNCAAALIYFFFLPETGGKSLEEIGEGFGDMLGTGKIGEIDLDKQRAMSLDGSVDLREQGKQNDVR